MENITLGDFSQAIAYIVALIGGLGFLFAQLKKWMALFFKEEMASLEEKLDSLDRKISTVDMESCKNYLTNTISKIDRGEPMNEVESERFWEQYEHYSNIGGNSYIKRRVEQLQKDEKI